MSNGPLLYIWRNTEKIRAKIGGKFCRFQYAKPLLSISVFLWLKIQHNFVNKLKFNFLICFSLKHNIFKSIWWQKVMVADSRKVMNFSFILLFWMFVLFQEKKSRKKTFLASMTILKQFWHKVKTLLLRRLVILVVLILTSNSPGSSTTTIPISRGWGRRRIYLRLAQLCVG